MTLVSPVFLTAALLYADIARYNSAAAALLMNVDSSSSAGSYRQTWVSDGAFSCCATSC